MKIYLGNVKLVMRRLDFRGSESHSVACCCQNFRFYYQRNPTRGLTPHVRPKMQNYVGIFTHFERTNNFGLHR